MKLKPIRDRIVIKKVAKEKKNEFGLIIPDYVTNEKTEQGLVVAAGPGVRNAEGQHVAMEIKVGDTVVFMRGAGQPIKVEGVDHIVLSEGEVIASISED